MMMKARATHSRERERKKPPLSETGVAQWTDQIGTHAGTARGDLSKADQAKTGNGESSERD